MTGSESFQVAMFLGSLGFVVSKTLGRIPILDVMFVKTPSITELLYGIFIYYNINRNDDTIYLSQYSHWEPLNDNFIGEIVYSVFNTELRISVDTRRCVSVECHMAGQKCEGVNMVILLDT